MRIASASGPVTLPSIVARKSAGISWALTAIFGLPIAALSSSMAATICLIAACAASSAPTTWASGTCLAPASTITMPSFVPATIRSSRLSLRSAYVGLMTNWPLIRPTRTPATVFSNGSSEMASAAEAPVIASTSASLSVSADMTIAMICVS